MTPVVIECCGYDQILDCLDQVRKNVDPDSPQNPRVAETMHKRYGDGKVCIKVHDNMTFSGWDCREYFKNRGHIIHTYEDVFGTPEEFGQLRLEDIIDGL
ncbi:MAG: hypothetical protein IIW69_08110 [Bacteroidaceae bacterium]|nr:hypothetical protein [Bacteroidaceae bacterium]